MSEAGIVIDRAGVVDCLRGLILWVLSRNTNLQELLIPLIVRSHIIHNIVLLHEDRPNSPDLLVTDHGSEYGQVALVDVGAKMVAAYQKLSLSDFKELLRGSIVDFELQRNVDMWDHAASLLEFANVLVKFASDVVVYVLKSF